MLLEEKDKKNRLTVVNRLAVMASKPNFLATIPKTCGAPKDI